MNSAIPWYLGNSSGFFQNWGPLSLVIVLLWSLLWKGLALWHSARRGEKRWFVALLCINTVGLLELTYLAFVVKLFSEQRAAKKKRP